VGRNDNILWWPHLCKRKRHKRRRTFCYTKRGGTAQTGALTFATSTLALNGQTHGVAITNSGSTFTFTPTLSGTLSVAGGGTGQTSFTSSQLLYGNGTNGLTSVGTTTFTPSGEFTTTGTIGAFVGGANSTLALAANGVGFTKIAQIAGNSVLVNNTSGTGNVTAIATSTFFGTGTGGQVLSWNNGVPNWVATTTFSSGLAFANGNVTNTGVTSNVAGTVLAYRAQRGGDHQQHRTSFSRTNGWWHGANGRDHYRNLFRYEPSFERYKLRRGIHLCSGLDGNSRRGPFELKRRAGGYKRYECHGNYFAQT